MIRHFAFFVLFSFCQWMFSMLSAQDMYRIFNSKGQSVPLTKMLRSLDHYDVVLFGELHNNSVAHWLELQVLKHLSRKETPLMLGMEMLEADNQLVMDEYLSGIITEKHFSKDVRLWDNHPTDYAPLIAFAKEHRIPVIATNVPARYANLVYRNGPSALDALSETARKFIAPLPITFDPSLPGYAEMIKTMGGHGSGTAENLSYAQALKDATMAHFILTYLRGRCLHINGSYHSMNREGIVWYLLQKRPDLKIVTIHTAEAEDVRQPDKDDLSKADFLILIRSDVVKSY